MNLPTIEIVPLRNAVSSDKSTTLDLIVRIIAPHPEIAIERPRLNIGLVIDRSGSMAGQKIKFARQAASYAVQQLLPTDRISITTYDNRVNVLVGNTLVENKPRILSQIQTISEGGSTNLHAGWLEGGMQVSQHLQQNQLNRIILLSDGLANVGQTNPDPIASDVHGLSQRGVTTTTMGIGDDYNEDLMTAMANSGDGNYYYIESPSQLPQIFATELQGIMATLGERVSLGIEPMSGVKVVDVFNELETTTYDRYKLPNLIKGNKLEVGIRLKVPPQSQESPLCQFRLAWNYPDRKERQTIKEALILPVFPSAHLSELPINEEVSQLIALLLSARAKQEIVGNLDRGDYATAKSLVNDARSILASAPLCCEIAEDMTALDQLESELETGDYIKMRKQASYQAYERSRKRDRHE